MMSGCACTAVRFVWCRTLASRRVPNAATTCGPEADGEDSAAVGVAVRQSGRGDRLADLAPDILALGETGERSNGDRVVRRVADRDLRPLRAWIQGSCAPRA